MKQVLEEELAAAVMRQEEAVAAAKQEAENHTVQLQRNLRHMQQQHG